MGGDVEQLWLVSKYDVIHKKGSTQRITTPPEEDRATATGKSSEGRTCSSEGVIADRQTHTDRQTDTLITVLRSAMGGLINVLHKRAEPVPVVTAAAHRKSERQYDVIITAMLVKLGFVI